MSAPAMDVPWTQFGLEIAPLTLDESADLAARAIHEHGRLLVGVVNAAKVVKMRRDPVLRDSLLACDVLLADGQSIVWASRLLRRRLPERVAGIDLFLRLLEVADREHLRVYLLGATPEVLAGVEEAIRDRYPRAVLAGSRDGYFAEHESGEVAEQIAAARPDLLFLGMTTPKKEIFLARYGDDLGVPVIHGVGGSFDVVAGLTRRAPERWQRLGLEWAYRVQQEPRRLWRRYLVTNTAFLGLLASELAHPHAPYGHAVRPLPGTTLSGPTPIRGRRTKVMNRP